jgi:exosortase N
VTAGLAFAYNVRIFYFFTIAFFLLFLYEYVLGRVSYVILFLLLFTSPFFEQVAVILGFPIRLQLSEWAGWLLSSVGFNIAVEGNAMVMKGGVFFVDDACMGLHLLSMSLLMGVFSLSHFSRRLHRQLPLLHVGLFFVTVLGLNVLSNLFRICILVWFSIPAENIMHDVIGLLCLVLYVMLPIYFLSNKLVSRFGIMFRMGAEPMRAWSNRIAFPLLSIPAIFIFLVGCSVRIGRVEDTHQHAAVELREFQREDIRGGVTKLTNDQFLVYVKPIGEFFSAEHTPLLCWEGSGYKFEAVRSERIGDREVYMGELRNGDQRLLTAWWYDNGKTSTVSQLEWRMRMLRGEPRFCLINFTASDKDLLTAKLLDVFNNDLLNLKEN